MEILQNIRWMIIDKSPQGICFSTAPNIPVYANLRVMIWSIWNLGMGFKGPLPTPEMGAESEEIWAQMAITAANYERSGIAQYTAEIISELPEFLSFRKMLDLGGGPGLIGISIVAADTGENHYVSMSQN